MTTTTTSVNTTSTANQDTSKPRHKILKEFVHDGIVLDGMHSSPAMMEKIKTMTFKDDDVLVSTYSKSGTTWMSYILKLIYKSIEDSHHIKHPVKIPFLEFQCGKSPDEYAESLFDRPSPRLFVTHMYRNFIQVTPAGPKVVVVMRNPKDTLVSYYHFYRMNSTLQNFSGTWDEFFELYKEKHLWGGDILDFNIGWWNVRHLDNVLILKYEDMKADPEDAIRTVAKFVGKDLPKEEIDEVVEKSSFTAMKHDPKFNGTAVPRYNTKVSSFMRKGEVGDWKNLFTQEQSDYIDTQCAQLCAPIGLHFKF